MLRAAAIEGAVVVALNSDEWLCRKKGYYFMTWKERAAILLALRYVDRVISVDDQDGTVAQAIVAVRPTYFMNGGDRTTPNEREAYFCRELGVTQVFGVGGGKIQSSSALVRRRAE
jgi:D-beta-D-heptose 7-phosphate kinase/D-beta-D-heptose 1-phosphate adenosyltransferase